MGIWLWRLLGAAITFVQPHVLCYGAVEVLNLDSHDPRVPAHLSQDKAETKPPKP